MDKSDAPSGRQSPSVLWCRICRPTGWVAPDLNIVTFADRPPPKVERVIITPALVQARCPDCCRQSSRGAWGRANGSSG